MVMRGFDVLRQTAEQMVPDGIHRQEHLPCSQIALPEIQGHGSDTKQAAETPCRVVGLRSVVIDEHPAISSVAEEGAAT